MLLYIHTYLKNIFAIGIRKSLDVGNHGVGDHPLFTLGLWLHSFQTNNIHTSDEQKEATEMQKKKI